jgi:hypothetical protein
MSTRDADFRQDTLRRLAARAGHRCSICATPTSGPSFEANDATSNIGEAAHIRAARAGGRRYDPQMTDAERMDIENGIWLCASHARLIDRDEVTWDVAALRRAKADAEVRAQGDLVAAGAPYRSSEGLPAVGPADALTLLGRLSPVPTPRRELYLAPYPGTGFDRRRLIAGAAGLELSEEVASALTFPKVSAANARRVANGLAWEAPCIQGGGWGLALGSDGSFALNVAMWEERSTSASPWGATGLGVGSCIEVLIAALVVHDRAVSHATHRRPSELEYVLVGTQGRRLLYDRDSPVDWFYTNASATCQEPTIRIRTRIGVQLDRDGIDRVVALLIEELAYHLGSIDSTFVRRRTDRALDLLGFPL